LSHAEISGGPQQITILPLIENMSALFEKSPASPEKNLLSAPFSEKSDVFAGNPTPPPFSPISLLIVLIGPMSALQSH